MSAFLQNLIPSSNRLEAAFSSGMSRQSLLEDSYDAGFVGAFGDSDDHPEWSKRARAYLRDEFLHDTDGQHLFSEVCGALAAGDGECHMNQADALRAWEAAGKIGVEPYTTSQAYGSCTDASLAELVTSLIGYRIARPEFNERWVSSVAWYQYADRGYCADGWDGFGIATVAKRNGIAFRLPYEIQGNKVDFTDDDRNEQIVARTWCRTGIPTWLREFTRTNHAFDEDAITQFDGGLPELKRLFAAGGCLHFSGTRTSGSNKPFVWGSTGPHMMAAYGYDDSDDYRRFCRDVLGISARVNDFPIQCDQTWGPGWRGEIADQYWPSWWGPKPEGAWVCWASEFVQRLSLDVAYLPKVKGFPGQGPQPEPDYPPIEGTLHGETVNGRIAIRGELVSGGKPYIVVPNGTGAFKVVPKPVL